MSGSESDIQHLANSIQEEFLIESVSVSSIVIAASHELDQSTVQGRIRELIDRDISFELAFNGEYNDLNNEWTISV